jgi:hypothetical protein
MRFTTTQLSGAMTMPFSIRIDGISLKQQRVDVI